MTTSSCSTCDDLVAPAPASAAAALAPGATASRSAWLAVGAIAVGTFVMVTTEFLPVGLLTDIARGLNVSDGTAGLMVTMPGVLAALAAPALTVAAGRLDRRTVMIALTALLLVSNLAAALAPSFTTMLMARLLLGLCVGGFWAFAPGVGTQLVPPAAQARAVALILAGISAGTVLGVPAGALLGSYAGWRSAFAVSAGLTLVVLLMQIWLLPALPAARAIRPRDLLRPLTQRMSRVGLGAVMLLVAGHFAAYTYLKPLLQQVFGLSPGLVTALLLIYGAAGFAGNFIGGQLVGRSARLGMVVTALLLAAALAMSTLVGDGLVAGVLVVVAWGMAFGMVPVSATGWMLKALPDAPEAGQAMLVTAFQVAIATGALLGGVAVDGSGIASAMLLGSALVMGAALVAGALGGARPAQALSAP
ncbi:MFS transporter [Variovorax guangxiensis]|uniref:MFS transporter n=1 Tax=Variovorax guangxiensis TaxID=1775474 RepID=A0A502E267_9BURK|nr:MFS transporter [Variovorax guangxiensis]TPG27104.1 MFS transporter [Variovorax ginsengisoli]TPG30832.1 MFS transporter [Variovorax guangxiensis]